MIEIILIKVLPREEVAPSLQEVLTNFGNIIKARLGLHNIEDDGENKGIIILHISTKEEKFKEDLLDKLNSLKGITAKKISI